MALVSGRPISFQMDLYTPLYIPRPTVVPELFASLRPVTYNGDLNGERFRSVATTGAGTGAGVPTANAPDVALFDRAKAAGDGKDPGRVGKQLQQELQQRLDLGGTGVSTMATATKLGDFFQYAIDKPITLPRQKSALLPIVNKDVEGTRVSIYNESTQAKFPLLGLKFKNTSGLRLVQRQASILGWRISDLCSDRWGSANLRPEFFGLTLH